MVGRIRSMCALAALLLQAFVSAAAAGEPVDLLLVLAADVSRSVDAGKFKLQRDGYAAAVTDPRVVEAIRSGPRGRIAVCFVEWSGVVSQKLVVDWMAVGDATTANAFADRLVEAPRSFADRTSISAGIDFAMEQFGRAPFEAPRRTIDVSGDGTNNGGRDVSAARDDAVAKGVTINGIVILSAEPLPWNPGHTHPPGGLGAYYHNNVVGGPNAFVMEAQDFAAFGKSLVNKLVAEIAALPPARHALLP